MNTIDLKKLSFINPNKDLKSFSLRVAILLHVNDKYLMVINENDTKLKHPGGHVKLNESLPQALKREVLEETGYQIDESNNFTFVFDHIVINGIIVITAYTMIDIDESICNQIVSQSLLPTKLVSLHELTDQSTWESEIRAINHLT